MSLWVGTHHSSETKFRDCCILFIYLSAAFVTDMSRVLCSMHAWVHFIDCKTNFNPKSQWNF